MATWRCQLSTQRHCAQGSPSPLAPAILTVSLKHKQWMPRVSQTWKPAQTTLPGPAPVDRAEGAVVGTWRVLTRALGVLPNAAATQLHVPAGSHDLKDQGIVVLLLIGEGYGNKAVSKVLKVNQEMIRSHVTTVMGELNVENATLAAIWAHKHGLAD